MLAIVYAPARRVEQGFEAALALAWLFRRREGRGMRLPLGAAVSAAIVLVGVVGAPTLPVMIGATLAYAWLLWRAVGAR
jgi:hypothetical protein